LIDRGAEMGSDTHGRPEARRRSCPGSTKAILAIPTGRTALGTGVKRGPAGPEGRKEVVELSRLRSTLASLFARRPREDYLAEYVIRECSQGRTLAEVLDDPYVVNRSTIAERAWLLERPEVIEAAGKRVRVRPGHV
jgi:hypothetical protein